MLENCESFGEPCEDAFHVVFPSDPSESVSVESVLSELSQEEVPAMAHDSVSLSVASWCPKRFQFFTWTT